jgi:hypothetical protein
MDKVFIKWLEEDAEVAPHEPARRVMAAWLVRDVPSRYGDREEVLAYLGDRPAVNAALREELEALYPAIAFDWEDIARAMGAGPNATDVSTLTDDELTLGLRALARERGLSPMDLALHLGYRQRQVLPEMLALLRDNPTVARFERTSGSVFDYLAEKHPEYAFLVYKARLFFEGDEAGLKQVLHDEPRGFSDAAWRARREFWQSQLDQYRARRAGMQTRPNSE